MQLLRLDDDLDEGAVALTAATEGATVSATRTAVEEWASSASASVTRRVPGAEACGAGSPTAGVRVVFTDKGGCGARRPGRPYP